MAVLYNAIKMTDFSDLLESVEWSSREQEHVIRDEDRNAAKN